MAESALQEAAICGCESPCNNVCSFSLTQQNERLVRTESQVTPKLIHQLSTECCTKKDYGVQTDALLGYNCTVDKSSVVRELTEAEYCKLLSDTQLVSDFKRTKLEKEAQKNWDLFYKRNTTKFFKDRHWTTREFQELCGVQSGETLKLLEVGCGVGNFLFPLMKELEHIFFYACDFSPRAVEFVKANPLYRQERCHAFQCDLTQDDLDDVMPRESIDIVTMIFVLSAINPDKMIRALQNTHKVVAPGGCVLLRDYGMYDHAMLRFKPGHKLADNFYVRQDGTRAYYFTLDKIQELFSAAGFEAGTVEYVLRETVNRKEDLCVPRVFVQAKFRKPAATTDGATIPS